MSFLRKWAVIFSFLQPRSMTNFHYFFHKTTKVESKVSFCYWFFLFTQKRYMASRNKEIVLNFFIDRKMWWQRRIITTSGLKISGRYSRMCTISNFGWLHIFCFSFFISKSRAGGWDTETNSVYIRENDLYRFSHPCIFVNLLILDSKSASIRSARKNKFKKLFLWWYLTKDRPEVLFLKKVLTELLNVFFAKDTDFLFLFSLLIECNDDSLIWSVLLK